MLWRGLDEKNVPLPPFWTVLYISIASSLLEPPAATL